MIFRSWQEVCCHARWLQQMRKSSSIIKLHTYIHELSSVHHDLFSSILEWSDRFSVSTNTNCQDKHCQYQHIKPIYIVNINTPVDTFLDAQWQAKPPISLVWTQNWKHLIISWNIYIATIMISPSTGVLLSGKRALLAVVTLGKFVSRCNKPLNSRKLPLT